MIPSAAAAQSVTSNPPNSASAPPSALPAEAPGVAGASSVPSLSVLQAGIASFHLQNFDAAAAKFAEAAAAPGAARAVAFAWLARANLHLHKLGEAETAAREATRLDPSLPAGQSALAEVYFRQAKFAEADSILRKLVQSGTSDARAYYALAQIYWATANNRAAKSNMDAAHDFDPDDPDISLAWAETLSPKEMLDLFRKRLAQGGYEAQDERDHLATAIAILQDTAEHPERSCKLASSNLPMETRLETLLIDARTLRGYGLTVRINDASSKLLIDTGSTGILVNSKIAEKAGVVHVADTEIGGIGDKGASSGYVGFARRLQVGGLVFENCYIDVVDKKNALGEDGLIGTDIFEDFLVDLNFPDAKLRLSELPPYPDAPVVRPGLHLSASDKNTLHNRWIPPQFSEYERAYRFDHFLLIPGLINHSPPKLFLIDTGSWDNFITPAAAKGYVKVHRDSDTVVKGLSGTVDKVYFTGDVTLTFGHFQQKRYDLSALDLTNLSDDVGTEISGTLGFGMLYLLDIKIDYRDQLVEFSYDPNRFH